MWISCMAIVMVVHHPIKTVAWLGRFRAASAWDWVVQGCDVMIATLLESFWRYLASTGWVITDLLMSGNWGVDKLSLICAASCRPTYSSKWTKICTIYATHSWCIVVWKVGVRHLWITSWNILCYNEPNSLF